jgi:hypothetical protein
VFEFFLIGVVYFLLDGLDVVLLLLLAFTPVVIFNHHHSLAFVVPGGARVLFDDCAFAADEEGFAEDAVDEHDVAFDCEEAGVVRLFEVVERVVFFDVLLEFVFEFVDILLLLAFELFVVDVFAQFDVLELLVHLLLFLDGFS